MRWFSQFTNSRYICGFDGLLVNVKATIKLNLVQSLVEPLNGGRGDGP